MDDKRYEELIDMDNKTLLKQPDSDILTAIVRRVDSMGDLDGMEAPTFDIMMRGLFVFSHHIPMNRISLFNGVNNLMKSVHERWHWGGENRNQLEYEKMKSLGIIDFNDEIGGVKQLEKELEPFKENLFDRTESVAGIYTTLIKMSMIFPVDRKDEHDFIKGRAWELLDGMKPMVRT